MRIAGYMQTTRATAAVAANAKQQASPAGTQKKYAKHVTHKSGGSKGHASNLNPISIICLTLTLQIYLWTDILYCNLTS